MTWERRRWRCSLLALAMVCAARAQITMPMPGAQLLGEVVDEDGVPVVGARVTLIPLYTATGPLPAPRTTVAAGGRFSFALVPTGSWRVCAERPGSDLLDPCAWAAQPPLVNVAAGQLVPNVRIVMERGQEVYVRLDDPDRALARKGRAQARGLLVTGVWSRQGRFLDLEAGAEDEGGETRRIVVPAERDVRLFVGGARVETADDKDKPVKAGDPSLALRFRKGDAARLIRLKVKAK